jgi:hypothetical protein
MLKPVRRVNRGRRAEPFTLPAPVGGLNGRDGLADMPPADAFVLDNWFPANSYMITRLGHAEYGTGFGNPVESLEAYRGGAEQKMLAFAGGGIYDATAAGAAGAALMSGRVSNRVQTVMFSNAGNQFLLIYSGADAPLSYDGTTLTPLVITGLTGTQNTLHSPHVFKARLFLAQQGQLGFYYLGVNAIQGAASYFDLSQVAKKGGHLVGIASVSDTSGETPADYVVFMTSEGEYIMYAGIDPSSADSFALVGRYYSARPIGGKGWFNFRSDLYIITEEGIISLSQIRSKGEAANEMEYLSAKLGSYLSSLNTNKDVHGWCANIYPRGNALVVNVPASPSIVGHYYQFVLNTNAPNTNPWCRYVGWDGISWCEFEGRLYFGTYDGRAMLADEGFLDDGEPIKFDCRQAYNYFDDGKGMGAADKHFHFGTFIVQAEGTPPISAALNVNFKDVQPEYSGSLVTDDGAMWDVASWDVASWAGSGETQNFTVPFSNLGFAGSIWMRTYLSGTQMKWFATRVVCEKSKGIVII